MPKGPPESKEAIRLRSQRAWAAIKSDPKRHAAHREAQNRQYLARFQLIAAKEERRRRARARRQSERLTRSYIKKVICKRSILGYRNIPEALVQAKRAELQLRRVLKDGNSSSNSETADLGAGA